MNQKHLRMKILLKNGFLAQLEKARQQLKMAEALGYGIKEDRYREFQASIENIEKKVHGQESTTGVFCFVKNNHYHQFKAYLFD